MGATAVPSIQFTLTGLVLPQEADILQGVQTDLNTAAGGNLSTTLTSPMGQVAQSETAIIGDKNDQIAVIAAQFDPNTASGRWQDALGQIYFMDRIEASGSVVTGNCSGLVGATIPAGSIVQDQAGYLWSSLSAVTFDPSGNAAPSFQCQTPGPVACPPGTLTTIYAAVIGWDSVTNAGAATPGTDVETRADFEYRRRQSVATNAVNSVNSIRARVLAVPNVLDAYVIDNPLGTVVNTGATNYPLAANSVYVAVVGGDPVAVAAAIWGKKSLGCNYNGNTSQIVYDTSQGSLPYPQYTVTWETPNNLPIYITVNLAINTNLPANIVALAQAAVLAAFNGQDNGPRARIASQLYAGRYFAGVAAIDPNVEIYSINLGTTASPTGTAVLLGIDQRPTLTAANIVVTQS
jgi:hypothetical protein